MAELSNLERSFDEIKNKTRVSTPNPWLDPKFNRIDPWGKEPGIRVDDIPERLGLIQQGQKLDLLGNDFIDLGDTPSNYGKSEQFVKTDGDGKLTYDWPYWIKAGSSIYYKKGNVGVGLSRPTARFHTYGDNILDGAVTINESGRDKDFRVEGDTEANLLFCDASLDAMGIGTNSIEGSGCRLHVVGDDGKATSATYNAFAVFVLDNDGHCFLQITAPSTHIAGINFVDDDSNPPAGSIYYNHFTDEMNFGVATNQKLMLKSTHALFSCGYIHLDSPNTYAVFVADSHNADSYVEYKEDNSTKWTAGFDYTDSFKYQISEGVPGTNVRFEIEPGASGLINCYQNIAVRNTKGILLYDNGNYVCLRAPALTADQIWVLPAADASQAGSPLVSDSSGTLSWAGAVDLGAGNFVTTGKITAEKKSFIRDEYSLFSTQGKSEGLVNIPFCDVRLNFIDVVNDSNYNAFPGIAKYDTDKLVMVYRQGTTHSSDKGTILMKTSSNMGKTWGSATTVYSDATYDVRDPSITVLSGGTFVVSFFKWDYGGSSTIVDGVHIIKSTDDGSTWGSPIQLDASFTDGCACSSSIVELANGDLILAIQGQDSGESYVSSHVIKSSDGGDSWSNEATIGDGESDSKSYQEPNLVLLANGDLVAMIRVTTDDKIYNSTSADSGATWSSPVLRFTGSGSPRTILLNSGDLLVVYRAKTTGSDNDVVSRISTDSGSNWTTDVNEFSLDVNGNDMMYASLIEVVNGVIAVIYSLENSSSDADIRMRYMSEGGSITPLGSITGKGFISYDGDFTVINAGFDVRTRIRSKLRARINLLSDCAYLSLYDSSNNKNIFLDSANGGWAEIGDLKIGGAARVNANAGTNDNLVLNAKGTGITYINYEYGSGGVIFGNGADSTVATMSNDGVLGLKETTTPSAVANFGKIYTKNDDKLYFQDGAGNEHEIAFV